MINLLPSDIRQNYLYARRNTRLFRWSLLLIVSIVGVGLIVAGGLFYMNQSINNHATSNQQVQQELKDQKIDEVQKEVQDISGSLRLVVQVLSKEILFSDLITQIGTVMPPNAVLTGLNISQVQGGIDLTAKATDHKTASQVLVNLQDPNNKIFEKADLNSINCVTSADGDKYPCTVIVRAQFVKSNPFLFINPSRSNP